MRRYDETIRGTSVRTSAHFCLFASSWMMRNIDSARDSTSRMLPWPLQRGQVIALVSPSEGRRRWRDISSKPKREMRPTWTRARSASSASRIRFSTSRWFRLDPISMKSITTSPPMSRRRSCRAISSAASKFVLSAVSSMSAPRVAREELMSIEISASVGSITTDPPEGSLTSRSKALSIWLSI